MYPVWIRCCFAIAVLCSIAVFGAGEACAQEPATAALVPGGFTWLDGTILVVYLSAIALMGVYLGRGQKNTKDFLLGGRSFHWFPVAISVIATELSAVTYMGSPAIAFAKDLRFLLVIFCTPVAVLISVPVVVTIFYRMQVYTIYEYLERRYNLTIRTLASVLFVALKGGWLATAIFTPSLALSVAAGVVDPRYCVIGMGLFATFYATVGGFRGVIWCDFVQFFILVGGLLIALACVLYDFGGNAAEIWAVAGASGRTEIFDFRLSPFAEFTFWSVMIGGTVACLSTAGTDQVVVQRYLAARSLPMVIKGAIAQSVIVVPLVIPMYLLGTGLFAYYEKHPEMMTSLMALYPDNPTKSMDSVFPHFIVHGLPTGIAGLVIASILAAAISAITACLNSLATVAVMDYYKRFFHRPTKTEVHYVWVSRAATLVIGLTATVCAMYVERLGTIIEIFGKISSLLTGPLVTIFFLGALSTRANSFGVFCGTLLGLAATGAVAQYTTVFWSWYAPIGLVVSWVSGYGLSLLWSMFVPPRVEVAK